VDLPSVRRAAAAAVLCDCPLLLHSAWQEHAAAVLREQLLTALSDDLDVLEGELLDGARSMPQGRFSTPPMLPEAVAMRRWICE
jgi:hypothetical protein